MRRFVLVLIATILLAGTLAGAATSRLQPERGADAEAVLVSEICFDDIDNDGNELTDCADPACEGSTGDPCETGNLGVCNLGTLTCSSGEEVCIQDLEPQPETPGAGTCDDGLDNDCDGATDGGDSDCTGAVETNCFDGLDDDGDEAIDCLDSDCEGATGDSCDTDQLGVCAAGTLTCSGTMELCIQDEPATDEICDDGLDNDCDGPVDGDDTDCQGGTETNCFDGLDDDGDEAVDCADPDCDGATDASCETGDPGICAAGTFTCVEGFEECVADNDATDETPGAGTCDDGLDNDCDGATDGDDEGCRVAMEMNCFDGVDNDEDDAIDCADSDCEGATDGACDTGDPGICAAGTYVCMNAEQVCLADEQPQPEGDMYDNCFDGLDNDCDGQTDLDDEDCTMVPADVWLFKLVAHKKVNLKVGQGKPRRVFAHARADTMPQEATVTLGAEFDPDGLSVEIDPDTVTQLVTPLSEYDDHEGDDDDLNKLFKFHPVVTCLADGAYTIVYTAEIDAPENRESAGDVLTTTTVVRCGNHMGGMHAAGRETFRRNGKSPKRNR